MTAPAADAEEDDVDLRPKAGVVLVGTAGIALVSALTLAAPYAVASTVLGALMIAGAEVDARLLLLPDTVTLGGAAAGIVAVLVLAPAMPFASTAEAALRAIGTALVVALLRWTYRRVRGTEGLGFGDVKLAAACGAWLPVPAIPLCFALATGAALVAVLGLHLRGRRLDGAMELPFGAFLCPALWLVYYATVLP